MLIYKDEIDNGLGDKLTDPLFTKIIAKVTLGPKQNLDQMLAILRREKASIKSLEELIGNDQPDLAFIVSILASVGWNLNDDIFMPDELWKARKTPIHKPINDMHDASKILGHIVDSYAVDKNGVKIADDTTDMPKEFDVEVAGVLYRAFNELRDRIEDIILKAESGEMFVSMEAWFQNFAYGILNPENGQTQVIDRKEDTAFLTKYLRSFGGPGIFKNYRIGRVLKDFIFAAEGFVEMPANPESVIKIAANKTIKSDNFTYINVIPKGGVEEMEDKAMQELQIKLDEAVAKLAEKDSAIAGLTKELEDLKAKDLETKVDEFSSKLEKLQAEYDEKTKGLEAEKVDLQKRLEEVSKKAESAEAELNTIRKTIKARERLGKLSEIKEIKDVDGTLAELAEMTDETFGVIMKYAGQANKEKPEETKPAKDDDEKKAEASLSTVEEKKDDPDLQVDNEDPYENELKVALATAKCLLRHDDSETEEEVNE